MTIETGNLKLAATFNNDVRPNVVAFDDSLDV